MKKCVAFALSVILAAGAIACTNDSDTPGSSTTAQTTTTTTEAPDETETEGETETDESETETDESESASGGESETLTGVGEGFGGLLTVEVTMDGDTIVEVVVTDHAETPNLSDGAIEQVPAAIVAANSTEVDAVAGATRTSDAIMYAVNNALDPENYPAPGEDEEPEPTDPEEVVASDLYQGFGLHNTARLGPGADDTETGVYSLNQVFAHALFDGDGKIVALQVDQLEVATPNYDGEGMPHFTGFPGQSYNNDENHDGTVDGTLEATQESFVEEVNSWVTKRERGEGYVMGAGTWAEQMDTFEALFIGMTVEEVDEWFELYTSDTNGRPLKAEASNDEDQAKYDALSEDEQAMLADVVSGATMSLNDSHGDIIGAIRQAYENRVALDIESSAQMGFGLHNMARLGPGSDSTETGVYSVNQVFANTLFDAEGRIVAVHVDQLEVATPNYDGEGMPHFTGFPGQSYNNDENHDGTVDGTLEATEESFVEEVNSWVTKRERGEGYVMGTGTWAEQMDAFEAFFVGMTVEEVDEWFELYTSDINGRPLKDEAANEDDQAKYDALTDDEQAMLADLVSSATMSLNDSHGDIIGAIRASFDNALAIDVTVGN